MSFFAFFFGSTFDFMERFNINKSKKFWDWQTMRKLWILGIKYSKQIFLCVCFEFFSVVVVVLKLIWKHCKLLWRSQFEVYKIYIIILLRQRRVLILSWYFCVGPLHTTKFLDEYMVKAMSFIFIRIRIYWFFFLLALYNEELNKAI